MADPQAHAVHCESSRMASSEQEPEMVNSAPVDAEEQAQLQADPKLKEWLKGKVDAEIVRKFWV